MWKQSLLLVAVLAGCDAFGGSSGSGGTPSDPNYTPVSVEAESGKTFVATGPNMTTLDGITTPTSSSANIQFVSAEQINLNGVILLKDADSNTFRSSDGTLTLQVNAELSPGETDQMLYLLQGQNVGGVNSITPLVIGNRTLAADIPHSGTAVYSGTMTVFNDLGQGTTMAGPVFFVSLDTAAVTGGVTYANRFVSMAPTIMSGGSFTSTLSSGEAVPVVTGSIDGAMYGAGAEEIGGTLILTYAPTGTPTETYVGYYGTTLQ